MTPLEKNARRLVRAMVEHFPAGATCEDLRRQFEKDTGLARQSFYNALHLSKGQGWLVGGGSPHNQNQLYKLSPSGSWKEEPIASNGGDGIGEDLDKDRLEYHWSGEDDANGANVALSSLIKIVSDNTASPRQRIKAVGRFSGIVSYGDVSDYGVHQG